MTSKRPIACDLSKLDDTARRREQQLLARFRSVLVLMSETESGFKFSLPADPETLSDLGEFLALERLCCPFLSFQLQVSAEEQADLEISGPPGAKEFLTAVLDVS